MSTTMKVLLIGVVCLLAVALADARAASQRLGDFDGDDDQPRFKFFVFGDSYADTGNEPKSSELTGRTHGWYYPYGCTDDAHDRQPTDRLSNGLIEPDFIAPRAEGLRRENGVDPSGMNFAVGGAVVYEDALFKAKKTPPERSTLVSQVGTFSQLLIAGVIDGDLADSVALIAFSDGRDYFVNGTITDSQVVSMTRDVTNTIAEAVVRLQDMGVSRVMVNTLPPMGCTPWDTVQNNYTDCVSPDNVIPLYHNMFLRHKLSDAKGVLLLDYHAVFTDIIHTPGSGRWTQFWHKYTPCCANTEPDGFCGQKDDDDNDLYTLCSNPNQYFYWDSMHLSEAGHKAVIGVLEDKIKNFLEI
ncbi:hypothetical protein ACP4OV_031339 [Aristida adscensionis]